MAQHIVKVLAANYITHDVKRFVLEKPPGFEYQSGENVYVSINEPGWETKKRPFSFTSLNEWPYLELIIKIYDDHNGVTNLLGKLNAGAELILHEVFGTIHYKGPGVFIAGGSGVTPFISIFRNLFYNGDIKGNKLFLSNKSSEEIIMPFELFSMLGNDLINIYTRQGVIGFLDRRIDRKMLIRLIGDFSSNFYVCGPKDFVQMIVTHLLSLGAKADVIIFDKKE
ncbi:MAG: FAD-binding oxidoreductase [Ginsengibacter sp.]